MELIIRIESLFCSFHEGYDWNNRRAHFCMAGYNVRIGYSIHTLHETTRINFQFLNKLQMKTLLIIFILNVPINKQRTRFFFLTFIVDGQKELQ